MEFNFSVNHLLADTITKLDCNIRPARRNADGLSQGDLRSQLVAVIDRMGDASSKAQGLYNVITSARKLQLSDHTLYIMKDSAGNGGRGTAIGILKIGHKKLFVYSNHGAVHEMEPLCVLDFYVHESRQRMGCGRKLFDYMLQDTGVRAVHLAIDKPSFKFSQFLKKHYNLRAEMPQVNNFVVFEGFFNDRPDAAGRKRSGHAGRPPQHPGRRRDPWQNMYNDREQLVEDGMLRQNTYNGYGLPRLQAANHINALGPGSTNSLGSVGTNSRPPSGSSVKARSAGVSPTGRKDLVDHPRNGHLHPLSDGTDLDIRTDSRNITGQELKSKGQQMYSRHINSESPLGQLNLIGSRPNSGNAPLSSRTLPNGIGVNGRNESRSNSRNEAAVNSRADPRVHSASNYSAPPMLRRGVTGDNYSNQLNMHQDYQGRRGHLKVHFDPSVRNPFLSPEEDKKTSPSWLQRDQSSWTVFNNDPNYLSLSKRNYTHTRLW